MTLNELYTIADNNNISVYYFPLSPMQSLSLPETIAIDVTQLDTALEEKGLLAHELGHCLTWSFYNISSKYNTRSRMEYRADRWVIHNLIPFSEFYEALQNGITERWQLAEYFDVTEDYIDKAITMYEQKIYDKQKE